MSNTRLMRILIVVEQGMMGVIWLGAAVLGLHARHDRERRRTGRGAGCALLVIGIDRFKRVNGIHGHEAGTLALAAQAAPPG